MEKTFKEGIKYSGEVVYGYGGCSSPETNYITVIKRNGNSITYQENFGKAEGQTHEAPIQTLEDWGEYIAVGEDRFFAYSVAGE